MSLLTRAGLNRYNVSNRAQGVHFVSETDGSTGAPAVVTRGLVKHFTDGDDTIEAVRGVDLEVRTGEIFGFLGPNGAGKSTTVRMLTTLLQITDGEAKVAGVDIAGTRTARGQDRRRAAGGRPDPRQTGRELLNLHGRLFGLDKSGPPRERTSCWSWSSSRSRPTA